MTAPAVAGFTRPHGAYAAVAASPNVLASLRTFHTLDALRGVAAVTILLYHAAFIYGIRPPAEGAIAVDLFFVMSGFIIAQRYESELRRGMGLLHFVKLRLIRLYPLFILGTVLGLVPAVIAILAGDKDGVYRGMVESFPLALFMLPSRYALPQIQELYPLNFVAWSLALEIVVNALYAATCRFWSIPRLLSLIAIAFVGLCVCAAIYGPLKYGYAWPQAPVGIVRVVYGFAMGVLICRFHQRQPFTLRVPWWVLLVGVAAIFFSNPSWGRPVWEVFAIAVLVPAIVAAAVGNEPTKRLEGVCAFAGIFSYVLYSLHAPFIGLFLRGETRSGVDPAAATPMKALLFSVLLVSVCVLVHIVYDQPIRRRLTRLMRGGNAVTQPDRDQPVNGSRQVTAKF